MSIAESAPITTLRISPPVSEKVTTKGPLPWLKDTAKTETSSEALPTQNAGWGGDGFGFDDFLDIINPLQHLPIISHFYREYTGDEIAAEARVIGGGLLGGPVGLAASAFNVAVEETTGDDVMGHLASLFEEGQTTAQDTQVATAAPRALMGKLPPAPQFASAKETLAPLDFGTIDDKAAPGMPPALPGNEDSLVLSLFAPEVTNARADYNAAQGALLAQEIKSELDG